MNGIITIFIDYKLTMNQVAKADRYSQLVIYDMFVKLEGGTVFKSLNLSYAYQQVVLKE